MRDLTHILHHSTPLTAQIASKCCPAIQRGENSFVNHETPPINGYRDVQTCKIGETKIRYTNVEV
jgi:hypothetical protein